MPIECHPLVRYMLLFSSANYFQLNSIPQLTLHRSVIVSSIVISLLISLQVLNFCMSSRTGPCEKRSQSSFSADLPWFMDVYAEHCHGPIFKHEYPNCSCSLTIIFIWNDSPFPLKNQKIRNKRSGGGNGKPDPSAILSFSRTGEAASILWLDVAL